MEQKRLKKLLRDGIPKDTVDFEFYPNSPQARVSSLILAILISLVVFSGIFAFAYFEIELYIRDFTEWKSKKEAFLQLFSDNLGLAIFGLLLQIFFFILMPAFCFHLWNVCRVQWKAKKDIDLGIYHFGVYLDVDSLYVRYYDRDDNLQEYYIPRNAILSVQELSSYYKSVSDLTGTTTRWLQVTWKETKGNFYITLDYSSFDQKDFIAMANGLKAVPDGKDSILSGI